MSNINYRLAKEIYGNPVWMVDEATFSTYANLLLDFRNGVSLEKEEEKLNSVYVLNLKSGVSVIEHEWQLKYADIEDDLVYVVKLNGPITKGGGASSYGTKDIANSIDKFDNNKRFKGGIMLSDSGGGSAAAVEVLGDSIKNAKKPIVTLIEKGGVLASAALYIASYTDFIMSDGANNKVGSIGTMAEFKATPKNSVDKDGNKMIRVYASKSTSKNKWYNEAVDNDNFEPLISEVLDPANEIFLAEMKNNRPNIKESMLDGSMYSSGDIIGTLIDGLGGMSDAISKVLELSNSNENKNNNNPKLTKMTKAEIKANHPDAYNEIVAEGVQAGIKAEADRTGSWLAHANKDTLEAVTAGIEGGGAITATAREKFLVAANANKKIDAISKENANDLNTPESENKNEPTEAEAYLADVLKNL